MFRAIFLMHVGQRFGWISCFYRINVLLKHPIALYKLKPYLCINCNCKTLLQCLSKQLYKHSKQANQTFNLHAVGK